MTMSIIPKLVPGIRFHPTDVELLKYFLKRKVMGKKIPLNVITELDIYQYSPWDLPVKSKSCLGSGDFEWFFFCPRGKKYCSGSRTNRATPIGFWKSTGNDRAVPHNNQTVGKIKTLVFHTGKAPCGDRTDWVIHEYRLEDKDLINHGIPQDSYVICKVFKKPGLGPRNAAQYGRPYNEQDWNGDDVEEEIPSAALSVPDPIQNITSNISSPQREQHLPAPASECIEPTSMSCLSGPLLSPELASPSDPSNQVVTNDDDALTLLDLSEDPNEGNKMPEENITEGALSSDFFEGLGDLDDWATLSGLSSGKNNEYNQEEMVTSCDVHFVEMIDLDSPLFCQGTTKPN